MDQEKLQTLQLKLGVEIKIEGGFGMKIGRGLEWKLGGWITHHLWGMTALGIRYRQPTFCDTLASKTNVNQQKIILFALCTKYIVIYDNHHFLTSVTPISHTSMRRRASMHASMGQKAASQQR